ncbi:MAG: sigma-54 dependent transcriptional regulator [Acidobacteriota bacterium]
MSKLDTLVESPDQETKSDRSSPGPNADGSDVSRPPAGGPRPSSPPISAPGRRQSDLIVGTSPAMAQVLELMSVVARTEIPVLVHGESGTGKELVARAIHYMGSRAAHPFITLNCGAIPETLMEDELFGHVRGAYTGAHAEKLGVFEEADGGTLFLDEIGELYPSCQVKLLRVLQEMEIRRLGENRTRRVNVRIIAASNKDLKKELQARRFREDLYHRISVLPIPIPPLRKRLEDLPLLVDHFVRLFAAEVGRPIKGFTPRALQRLATYSWPGNVRELANRVKQAMVMSLEEIVDIEALSLLLEDSPSSEFPTFRQAKAEFERSYVIQCLRLTRGKVSMAAKKAGKDRKDFYYLMKKHGIDPDDFRA